MYVLLDGCTVLSCSRTGPRLGCSVTKHSVDCFIELVQKLEQQGIPARGVAVYLRKLGYDGQMWSEICDYNSSPSITILNTGEKATLMNMMQHKYHYQRGKKGSESGVVLTRDGTVALRQVVAGIDCGGYNRATSVYIVDSKQVRLDNLFVSTISRGIGQTALAYYSDTTEYDLFGPKGKWDNPSCPSVYEFKSKNTRMTYAEVLGDIDGFILGYIVGKTKDKTKKLSDILSKYYQGDGIEVDGRKYCSTNRAVTFGELVPEADLWGQSKEYAKWHYAKNSNDYGAAKISDDLLLSVPVAVKKFFETFIRGTRFVIR